MDWLNIHVSKCLGSPEFRLADPKTRGTWLSLLGHCASQENSGIIDNCERWTERQWQQLCGISKRDARTETSLWEWFEGSLIVKFYPIEKQNEVQHLRAQAKAGADARWHAGRHRNGNAHGDAGRHADGNAEGKGREIERKGREGEAAYTPTPMPSGCLQKPEDRFRALLTKHGCVLDHDGKDIFPQWRNALAQRPVSWAEHVFETKKKRPPWPSDFRKLLKELDGEYEHWNFVRKKETERITKETA